MNGGKKVSLKSLGQELEIIKEQVKEISVLKEKVASLEEIIENLKVNGSSRKETKNKEKLNCRKCDEIFECKNLLKNHIRKIHPSSIQCKLCEKVFSRNSDLEAHIKAQHETATNHKCEYCDKTFVLKWRAQKHEKNHLKTDLKRCHYFNNALVCPFEEIGCMFAHETSELCRFDQRCSYKMCPYRHTIAQEKQVDHKKQNEDKEKSETQDVSEAEKDQNRSYGENDCHLCDEVFQSVDSLCEHFQESHHDYHQKIVLAAEKRHTEASQQMIQSSY